jgi:hypothetical protein
MTATLTRDQTRPSQLTRKVWLVLAVTLTLVLLGLLIGGPDLTATHVMTDPNFAA